MNVNYTRFALLLSIGAFCALFPAAGAAAVIPQPLAGWYGDFDVTEKNGCTLTLGEGNTIAADGSTITIGQNEGVRVSWGTQRSSYTVVVRYRDMSAPSSGAVLAGHAGGSSSGFLMTRDGKAQGMYLGKAYSKSTPVPYPVGSASGCYAMAFSKSTMAQSGTSGQVLYVKEGDGEWRHHSTNGGVIISSDDVTITGCVVAGPCAKNSVKYEYSLSTMAGMKIESIVVFAEPLTLQEVSACRYPARIRSAEISRDGTYDWAELPWRGGLVPVGDVGTERVEIKCDADVTIADSSLAVTAAAIGFSGMGTLRFAGRAEFAARETGSIEMNLSTTNRTMTADGALTLSEGDWYLGRPVSGYKAFTVSGTNPLTLDADATLSVYDGRIGSSVSGYGTIRCVDLFPRAKELDVALQDSALWHGNCVLEDIDLETYQNFNPDSYGNETSKLTFNGVKIGYLKFTYPPPAESATPLFKPEIAIENHSNKGGIGFALKAGATGAFARFRKVSGDGSLVDLGTRETVSANHMLVFQDWESFTGSVEVNSNLRVTFGETYTGSGVNGGGIVLVRPGAPLSLGARSKIHGCLGGDTGAVVVQGILEVVSGRSLCGGRVSVTSVGELVFDADKARSVSDATLTDCSADVDMSGISGDGLVRFKGSYSPFVLPRAAACALPASMNVRIDGATVEGDMSVASRFGGSGTFGGGTLTILDGATLDLTWGTMTLDSTAVLADDPASFTVVDDNFAATGTVRLFLTGAAAIPESWRAITVNVVSSDGTKIGRCRTVLRADGLYGERVGLTVRLR